MRSSISVVLIYPNILAYMVSRCTRHTKDKSYRLICLEEVMDTKKCPRCNQVLLVDNFYVCSRYKDGRNTYCITCNAELNKIYRIKHKATEKKRKADYIIKNRELVRKYARSYKYKNTENRKFTRSLPESKRKVAEAHLRHKYGMTLHDKEQMIRSQNYKCKICGSKFKSMRYAQVDHNHITGKIRSILCVSCNSVLGRYNEDIKVFENMIKYLKEWR